MKKPHPQPAKPIDRQALADGVDMLNDAGEEMKAISEGYGWEDNARVPSVPFCLSEEMEQEVGDDKDELIPLERDAARAWLKKAKFSEQRQEFILAIVFEKLGKPGELAKRFNKRVEFIQEQLDDPAIKSYTAILRHCLRYSVPLPSLETEILARELGPIIGIPLPICKEVAQQLLKLANIPVNAKVWTRGDNCIPWSRAIPNLHGLKIHGSDDDALEVEILYEPGVKIPPTTAQEVVELIKAQPALLLHEDAKPLLEAFVDILEAANYGASARRVKGIVPAEGSRKKLTAFAFEVLKPLSAARAGHRLNYPIGILSLVLRFFWGRVSELQRKWNAQGDSRRRGTAGIPRFRELRGKEFAGISKTKLLNILTNNPKAIAAALAEEATGISAETFLRAQRECSSLKKQGAAA